MKTLERWKPIPKSLYEISDFGRIRQTNTREICTLSLGKNGYYRFPILINGVRNIGSIHRLVAKMFIPNPKDKPQVNHKDGDKTNNKVENLEWVTGKENMAHAINSGLYHKYNNQTYKGKFGKNHNRSIPIICGEVTYESLKEASKKTGVPLGSISNSIKYNRKLRCGMHFQLKTL